MITHSCLLNQMHSFLKQQYHKILSFVEHLCKAIKQSSLNSLHVQQVKIFKVKVGNLSGIGLFFLLLRLISEAYYSSHVHTITTELQSECCQLSLALRQEAGGSASLPSKIQYVKKYIENDLWFYFVSICPAPLPSKQAGLQTCQTIP